MKPIPLVTTGSPDETSAWLRADRINMYPEIMTSEDGRTKTILRTAAGLALFASAFPGPIRGTHAMGDVLYVVTGQELMRVLSNGAVNSLGLVLGSDRCSFADGFIPDTSRFLIIGTGDRGYVYDTVSGFAEIVDLNFTARAVKTTPEYLNGYTLWPTDDGFIISDQLDPMVYPGSQFVTAESSTDGVVGLKVVYGTLWVLGSKTIEVFAITTSNNIFERVQTIQYGCASPWSITLADNGIVWLDQTGRTWKANGYTPSRISTHQIEQRIPADASQAFMFTFIDRGHEFVALTVDETDVYDVATQVWSRRKSFDSATWRANCSARVYGMELFGDGGDARVWKFAPDDPRESDGVLIEDPLVREWYSAYLHDGGNPLVVSALHLTIDTGNAEHTGTLSETAPVMGMRYSDDGGKNWSNWKQRSIGAIGEYLKTVHWHGLGSIGRKGKAAQRVFHFRITDPVRADAIALGMN